MTNQANDMFTQIAQATIKQALLDIEDAKKQLDFAQNEIESMSERDRASRKFNFQNYRVKLYTKAIQDLKAKIEFTKSQYKMMTGNTL